MILHQTDKIRKTYMIYIYFKDNQAHLITSINYHLYYGLMDNVNQIKYQPIYHRNLHNKISRLSYIQSNCKRTIFITNRLTSGIIEWLYHNKYV